ncbi:uncharacterized protein METZ01_LOCUS433968, partial [marine metagenome]
VVVNSLVGGDPLITANTREMLLPLAFAFSAAFL